MIEISTLASIIRYGNRSKTTVCLVGTLTVKVVVLMGTGVRRCLVVRPVQVHLPHGTMRSTKVQSSQTFCVVLSRLMDLLTPPVAPLNSSDGRNQPVCRMSGFAEFGAESPDPPPLDKSRALALMRQVRRNPTNAKPRHLLFALRRPLPPTPHRAPLSSPLAISPSQT